VSRNNSTKVFHRECHWGLKKCESLIKPTSPLSILLVSLVPSPEDTCSPPRTHPCRAAILHELTPMIFDYCCEGRTAMPSWYARLPLVTRHHDDTCASLSAPMIKGNQDQQMWYMQAQYRSNFFDIGLYQLSRCFLILITLNVHQPLTSL
jgi:hypothetical protein